MPAAAPWIAMGVSAVAGAMSANKAAGAAGDAAQMQKDAAMSQLQFNQDKYNRYKGIYGPLEEQQAQEALSQGPLDYGLIRQNIDTQYQNAGKSLTAQANRSGAEGMGLDDARQLNLDISHGNALSTAYGQGLQAKRNFGLSVMNHNQLPNAGNAYSSALGNLSSMYGGWRGDANQAAIGAWSGAGNALNGMARYGMANNGGGTPPVYGSDFFSPSASGMSGNVGYTDNGGLAAAYGTGEGGTDGWGY